MKPTRIITAVVALGAILLLAACGNDGGTGARPSPTPTTATHTEAEWTIQTPAGWTRTDITADADASKAIRYAGPDGRYVIVAINPKGSGLDTDAVWRYEVAGNGFEIVEKTDCTGGEGCSIDDERYDVAVLAKSTAEPPKVGGHVYYFLFGDTDSKTADAAAFEQIIESVQAK